MSTTVAALAEISPIIPTLIFGSMAITSGLITFILPGEEFDNKKRPQHKDKFHVVLYFSAGPTKHKIGTEEHDFMWLLSETKDRPMPATIDDVAK